jgi:hypothetical protein
MLESRSNKPTDAILPSQTLDLSRRVLEPQAPQGGGEGRSRVGVGTLELRQARRQQMRIGERDERSLETCAAEEPHGGCLEPLGIFSAISTSSAAASSRSTCGRSEAAVRAASKSPPATARRSRVSGDPCEVTNACSQQVRRASAADAIIGEYGSPCLPASWPRAARRFRGQKRRRDSGCASTRSQVRRGRCRTAGKCVHP